MKTHKIRLYPSKAAATTLQKWMGAARWTYNQCVSVQRTWDKLEKERARVKKETKAMEGEDERMKALKKIVNVDVKMEEVSKGQDAINPKDKSMAVNEQNPQKPNQKL